MIDQELTCLVVGGAGCPRGLLLDWSLVFGVVCAQVDGEEPVDTLPWQPYAAAQGGARPSEVAWLMESRALRHVPLSNETGSIVGMLAVEDAFALVLDELTALAAVTCRSTAATGRGDGVRRGALLHARDVQTLVPALGAEVPARVVAEHLHVTPSDALVVVEDQRPIGIVSERALLARFVAGRADPAIARAGDLVERPAAIIGPDAPVSEVLACMTRPGVHRVAVAWDRGHFGIVTLRDLLSRLVLEIAARVQPMSLQRAAPAAASSR
jgi:CBS domain-containing protein